MVKGLFTGIIVFIIIYYACQLMFTEDKTILGYDTNKIIDYNKLFKSKLFTEILPPFDDGTKVGLKVECRYDNNGNCIGIA